MGKIFVALLFTMLIVLSAVGCATQNTVRNYGQALTPSESAPPPVRATANSSRDESARYTVYRSSTGPYAETTRRGYNTYYEKESCGKYFYSHFSFHAWGNYQKRNYVRTHYTTRSYHWGR